MGDVSETDLGVRAASRVTNCGCQCSNTVFKDKYGKINGNCKSADKTGAVWCYVDNYSSCSDLQRSTRFNKNWSYEACATPDINSYECRNGGFNNGGSGFNNGNNGFNNGGSGFNNGNNGFNNG